MGNPTYKAPAIEQFLNDMTGRNRVETIKRDECVICDEPAVEFKTQRSIQEYNISGMCQACQDSVFSKGLSDADLRALRERLERHNAKQIRDIFADVKPGEGGRGP